MEPNWLIVQSSTDRTLLFVYIRKGSRQTIKQRIYDEIIKSHTAELQEMKEELEKAHQLYKERQAQEESEKKSPDEVKSKEYIEELYGDVVLQYYIKRTPSTGTKIYCVMQRIYTTQSLRKMYEKALVDYNEFKGSYDKHMLILGYHLQNEFRYNDYDNILDYSGENVCTENSPRIAYDVKKIFCDTVSRQLWYMIKLGDSGGSGNCIKNGVLLQGDY